MIWYFLLEFLNPPPYEPKIHHIEIKTSSENHANCNNKKCLRVKICQTDDTNCCSTPLLKKKLKRYEIQWFGQDYIGNCYDFPIDKTLPIEFTFIHETGDGWKGVQATVHLHQNEEMPYVCPISKWLDDDESHTTNCESPFIVSEFILWFITYS